MLLSPLPGVLAPDLSLSNGIWAGLPLFPCTQLDAIPWHTEVWGIAVCSSTAAAFRRWAKRSPHRVDLSVWLAPWDSVGWKVRQKWMLYKYFWDLEIQATEKAGLRADSKIRICISHHSDGALRDTVCLALPSTTVYPSRSSREWWHVRFASLCIPVLSYLLKNSFSLFSR